MKQITTLIVVVCCALVTNAQTLPDSVIFSYGGINVPSSEFLRMYLKNNINNRQPDLSVAAMREYVGLYSKFKMKVTEAEAAGIDTLPSIKSELTTYQKQLAKSYLTDKDMVSRLSKEAYERMKKEISASHILISVPKTAGKDTLAYARKADSVYTLLNSKALPWDTLVKMFTDDKNTIPNGGSIGYFTALQVPYEFETVAYLLPINGISKPVRTQYGYHIIKKTGERPAKGQVKVAHILCAAKKSDGEQGKIDAKAKADSILAELKRGVSFDSLAKYRNDDRFSANNFGQLAPFGAGAMVSSFEDAAFALKKPGDLSSPVLTDYGYHIIKLMEKLPLKPFEEINREINGKVERDSRMEIAKQIFLTKMKQKNKLVENPSALDAFIESIPDSVTRNGVVLVGAATSSGNTLFTINGKKFTTDDFKVYLDNTARGRLYGTKQDAVRTAYNNFVEAQVLAVEEANLATENNDYRLLLKEYRDGIILFDLTDKNVWSKASADTLGLSTFFKRNRSKYTWQPGFDANLFKFSDLASAQSFLKSIQNGASVDTAMARVNAVSGSSVTIEPFKVEYDKADPSLKTLRAEQYSAPIKNSDNSYSIYYAKTLQPEITQKEFNEARGYVIADYQDYLEKNWLAELQEKYPVVINEKLLAKLPAIAAASKQKPAPKAK